MVVDAFISLFQNLIASYGYVALFFGSIISASTVIIPMPLYVLIFFASSLGLNILLVSIVSGIGSGIGEITGYWVGAGGRKILGKKIKKMPKKLGNFSKFIKDYGIFAVFALGVLPFPFDIVGIISGASNLGMKKFLLAAILSKIIKNLMIAYAGYLALPFLQVYLHPLLQ
ncbi:MAG: VTT domain-containing protein [Candidatus Aenigmarchaeota archaeon]|nr:VTT domain-containing protein [Candidatus Aenigmarchaeota archaeon]